MSGKSKLKKEIEKYKAIFGDLTGDALTKKLNEIIKGLTDAINSDIDSIKKAFADFEAKAELHDLQGYGKIKV